MLVIDDDACCQALLQAQGTAALVPLLSRAASPAAVSAASALASLTASGHPARLAAREAGALEALLPQLNP